jgi:hypothetical protein
MNKKLRCLYIALFLPSLLLAQEADDDLSSFIKPPYRSPSFQLSYGLTQPSLNGLTSRMGSGSILEFSIGVRRFLDEAPSPDQLDYAYPYFVASYRSAGRGVRDSTDFSPIDVGHKSYRFGAGIRDGFGYKVSGGLVLTPYVGSGLYFTAVGFETDSVVTPAADVARLRRFTGSEFRYGTNTEIGLTFDAGTRFAIDLCYENQLIYPAYIFPQALSNMILQQTVHILIRKMMNVVFAPVPFLVPVMSAVLKGGLNLVLYNQRRFNMNFPFNGEPAFHTGVFKFGITFSF